MMMMLSLAAIAVLNLVHQQEIWAGSDVIACLEKQDTIINACVQLNISSPFQSQQ